MRRISYLIFLFFPLTALSADWTQDNRPGRVPDGPPLFLAEGAAPLRLPLDGNLEPAGQGTSDLQVQGGDRYERGVCGQALVGELEIVSPDGFDLRRGTLEFWLRSNDAGEGEHNTCFVQGPFTYAVDDDDVVKNGPLLLYFDDDGDTHLLTAGENASWSGRWRHCLITWRDDEISIYADGRLMDRLCGQSLATTRTGDRFRRIRLGAEQSLLDEVALWPRALEPEEAANAYFRYRDRSRLKPVVRPAVRLRAQYLPSDASINYRLAAAVPEEEIVEVAVSLRDAAGNVLHEATGPFTTAAQSLQVADLANGQYELTTTAVLQGGETAPGETFRFRRRRFAWEGNSLGLTETVYPPFVPIVVDGESVTVVGRTYRLGPLGLPDQIAAAGRELLAEPVSIRLETADGEEPWSAADGRFTETRPHVAIWEGQATAPAIHIETRATIEIDGCVKYEMSLAPGTDPTEIERLWIEIPIRNSAAPLMHVVTAGLRHNASQAVPEGEGVVWNGADAYQYQTWLNAFVPYIWLGSPNRGLAWFAENDRGWSTRKEPDAAVQELVREGDRLVLRIYLIDHPTTVTARRDLVFGLQASPTKPMPVDWRKRLAEAPTGPACAPWGGLTWLSQTPLGNDWRLVAKVLEVRYGRPRDRDWLRRYAEAFRTPAVHARWPWLDAMEHFMDYAEEAGPDRPLVVYHEAMRGCDAWPEWAVFQDEWTAESDRYYRTRLPDRVFDQGYETYGREEQVTFPRSYQDFGCAIANEWLRRGVGLYWDNTYPIASTNTRTTAAYRAADGRIQPAMIIWNQREYTKRAWHLMQYWRSQRREPLEFTLHMTNTMLLPVHTWSTVHLDHEIWEDEPLPPEFLLTESIGRQVGCMALTCFDLLGTENERAATLPRKVRERCEWGMRVVHEIQTDAGPDHLLRRFGYGEPRVAVQNYWADRPVLDVTPQDVKWLILKDTQSDELLVVLASWRTAPVKAEVYFDRQRLNLSASASFLDAETGEVLAVTRGLPGSVSAIEVPLSGPWGNRVLHVRP